MGWEEASGNLRAPEQYTGEGRGRDQVWRKFRPPDGGGGGGGGGNGAWIS